MAKMPLESEKIKITSTKSEILDLSSSQSFSSPHNTLTIPCGIFEKLKYLKHLVENGDIADECRLVRVCSNPLDPDVIAIMTGSIPTSRLMASVSDTAVDAVVFLDALGVLLASDSPTDLDLG